MQRFAYDVVVIGGGIIGSSTARELLKRNPSLRLAIVEKEGSIGFHQSGHNSGVIHSGIYYTPGTLKAKLCVEGLDLTYKYCDEKSIPYKKCGKLIVAVKESELERLDALYKRAIENEVKEISLIKKEEILKKEPNINGLKAIWSPNTGIVDWGQVTRSFADDCKERGADIYLNFPVTGFRTISESSRDSIVVDGKTTSMLCKYVVTCGGLHSDKLAMITGCSPKPRIIPFRGDYLVLKPEKAHMVKTNIYPVPHPDLPFLGVHITPRIDGSVWLGPNAVLASHQEGYRGTGVKMREVLGYIEYSGLRKLAQKHLGYGIREIYRGINISAQVQALQEYMPSLSTQWVKSQFPTVEKRCEKAYGSDYVPLPASSIFVNNLLVRLALSSDSKQYVEWRDKANGTMQLPVIGINTEKKELWPVIAIAQNYFLVCCAPFLEDKNVDRKDLLKVSAVSVGFSVLLGVLNFLATADRLTCLIDLDNYLTLSMPFGTPSDTDLSSVPYINKFHSQKFMKRQPAWKPFDYKGKQQISFKILEFVRSVQSDQSGGICHLETFGQISVKADVEGTLNDATVSLLSTESGQPLSLDSVVVHPCVNVHGPSSIGSGSLKRFRFSPPSHEFIMLQYCSPFPKEPPMQGVFKMLGETSVELLIQLKLNDKVKNSFDYCDLILVFFNRGPVKNMEFNVNHGSPKLAEDKHSLKWTIGSKFPRDLEAVLTAKLEFLEKPVMPNSDSFCVDKNCYAQINFKQSNSTLSGCSIDPKNVTVSEGSKPKIIIERSVQSTEYRIWNNYGDLPFPVNIVNKFNKVFS